MDTLSKGTVTLQVGDEIKPGSIGQNGQAHFLGISSEFKGASATVMVEAPGFKMQNPFQKVTLHASKPVLVAMIPTAAD